MDLTSKPSNVFLVQLPKIKPFFWLILATLGQATALQMVLAGNQLRYQHFLHPSRLLEDVPPQWLLLFCIQILAVSVGLWGYWRTILRWIRSNFTLFAIVGICLVFVLTSATVSHELQVYLSELVFASFIQLVNLGNILLVVLTIPDAWSFSLKRKLNQWLGESSPTDLEKSIDGDRFPWIAAAWITLLAAFLSITVYQNHPHVQDEIAYLYHARFLAKNTLTMPAPPVPEAFDFYLMQFDGARWYPSPPVGWPALLSIGVRLGVPWLVNPLLAGINVVLIYKIIYILFNQRVARITTLLFAISPWYIFMGMNFMTHMFTLTCALAATLWIIRSRETGQKRWALYSGLALGVMSLIRPLEALIITGVLGLWAIGIGGKRLKPIAISLLILMTGLISSLVLPYNYRLTGNARTFPINAYTDQRFGPGSNAYGFGPDRGMGWAIDPNPGHSAIDGLINANLNLFSINIELFGWSIGSLLLIAIFVFSGHFQRNDYLMIAVILAVFTVFFFYYFSGGPDFGARYWFLMIVPLVVLSVRGIEVLEKKVSMNASSRGDQSVRVLIGVLVLSFLALVNFFPWRSIDKYYHYLGMSPDILTLVDTYQMDNALVFISGENFPDYASAAIYNPVDMYSDNTIFAWNSSIPARNQVIQAYPDRSIWLVDGPGITGDTYQVVAGPLTAHDLIAQETNQ